MSTTEDENPAGLHGYSFGDDSDEEDARDPFRYDSPSAGVSRSTSRLPSPVLGRSRGPYGLRRLPSLPDLPYASSLSRSQSSAHLGDTPVVEESGDEDEDEKRVWGVMQRLQRLKSAEILAASYAESATA